MKTRHTKCIAIMVSLFTTAFSFGQEHHAGEAEKFTPEHSLGLAIGHAQVFNGRDAFGNKKVLSLPYWGIDYNFRFKEKWAVGLHMDIIAETFEVEKHLEGGGETEVVERTRPFAPAIMAMFKPNHHWNFGLGMGAEFAKEENYTLTRAAIEYGSEIRKGWEVFGALQYDFRWKAYDTWTIGLGIAKVLNHHANKTHPLPE